MDKSFAGNHLQVEVEGESMVALETWILLEYCNQGTLSYAIERGKFDQGFIQHGRRSNKPYLPSIRQALLFLERL